MSLWGKKDAKQDVFAFIKNEATTELREKAAKLLRKVGDDESIQKLLEGSESDSRVLLEIWRHRKNFKAIDAYLKSLSLEKRVELLDLSSHEYFEEVAERDIRKDDSGTWSRMSGRHPIQVIKIFEKRAKEIKTTTDDPHLAGQVSSVLISFLVRNRKFLLPKVLNIAEDISKIEGVQWLDYGTWSNLMKADPERTSQLYLQYKGKHNSWHDFAPTKKTIKRVKKETVIELIKINACQTSTFIRFASPSDRLEMYNAFTDDWKKNDASTILSLGTQTDREAVAKKVLELPAYKDNVYNQCKIASCFSWQEAEKLIANHLKSSDVNIRGQAATGLLNVSRYSPKENLKKALALLKQKKNEQEPVRKNLLDFLNTTPVSRFVDHTSDLEEILQSNLERPDSSEELFQKLQIFLVKFSQFNAKFSMEWLVKISKRAAKILPGQASKYLSSLGFAKKNHEAFTAAVKPIVQEKKDEGENQVLIDLATIFGRRQIRFLPWVLDMMQDVILDEGTVADTLKSVVTTLFRMDAKRLANVSAGLIEKDKSFMSIHAIEEHFYERTVCYPDAFLTGPLIKGKLDPGKKRFLPGKTCNLTFAQQTTLLNTIKEVLGQEEEEDMAVKQKCVILLGLMNSVDPAFLGNLARLDNEDKLVRDLAVTNLGRLPGGAGMPMLLEALGDDRASVAIYALRSRFSKMSAEECIKHLRSVSLAKVSVAKEVVRMFGDLEGGKGYEDILKLEATEKIHDDVYATIVSVLTKFLEREEALPIVEKAAQSRVTNIARAAMSLEYAQLPSEEMQERVTLKVVCPLLEHEDQVVREEVLHKVIAARPRDPTKALPPILLKRLLSFEKGQRIRTEQNLACNAFLCLYENDSAVVLNAYDKIKDEKALLHAFMSNLSNRSQIPSMKTVFQDLIKEMAKDDSLTWKRLHLLAKSEMLEPLKEALVDAAKRNLLGFDAMNNLNNDFTRRVWAKEEDSVELEKFLRSQDDALLRRIGFSCFQGLSQRSSEKWSDRVRGILEEYKKDKSPLISGVAQFIFPPPKTE